MKKSIAIIGAGLAGLRAALELTQDPALSVSVFEKSKSVGGRIATRRFGLGSVNHGAQKFDGWDKVLLQDEEARAYSSFLSSGGEFLGPATLLPKAMKDRIHGAQFSFETKITKIDINPKHVELTLFSGEEESRRSFDQVIITAPIPQVEALLGAPLDLDISYHKEILMLGYDHLKKLSLRLELDPQVSEEIFDWEEGRLLERVQKEINRSIVGLDLKKWRFSEVSKGMRAPFHQINDRVWLAGDAFDPESDFNASSAWFSGKSVAQAVRKS